MSERLPINAFLKQFYVTVKATFDPRSAVRQVEARTR